MTTNEIELLKRRFKDQYKKHRQKIDLLKLPVDIFHDIVTSNEQFHENFVIADVFECERFLVVD